MVLWCVVAAALVVIVASVSIAAAETSICASDHEFIRRANHFFKAADPTVRTLAVAFGQRANVTLPQWEALEENQLPCVKFKGRDDARHRDAWMDRLRAIQKLVDPVSKAGLDLVITKAGDWIQTMQALELRGVTLDEFRVTPGELDLLRRARASPPFVNSSFAPVPDYKGTPFLYEGELWPIGHPKAELNRFFSSGHAPECSDGEDPRFEYRWLNWEMISHVWVLYRSTRDVSSFEQLRHVCRTAPPEARIRIAVQRVPGLSIVDIYDDPRIEITPRWQRAWSIHIRQMFELLSSFGWYHPSPSGAVVFRADTGFPVLRDIHLCVSIRQARLALVDMPDSDLPMFHELAQLRAFASPPLFVKFEHGIELMMRHATDERERTPRAAAPASS